MAQNQVILFEQADFHGQHKHVFTDEPNLNAADDGFFNDRTSSIVVVNGTWTFYRDWMFSDPNFQTLGQNAYSRVGDVGIPNDAISSLRPTNLVGSGGGKPIRGHAILFEDGHFHGQHKHVFSDEPNLNAVDDSFFNDRTSSIVVISGNWEFFRNSGFDGRYPTVLGPGLYPAVTDVGIANDDLSSLRPTSVAGQTGFIPGHVILFEDAGFHGAHKHVFLAERNLNAADDSFFNDRTSSIVILDGNWSFFKNSDFDGSYPYLQPGQGSLSPGIYDFVERFGITNDDISSLLPEPL
jgi:hypothetical protein